MQYYQDAADDAAIPGLMHAALGGYHVRDIEFSAAFDVVKGKVGLDLSEAIWAHPNNTIRFASVPYLNVPVCRGMTHDGLGRYLREVVEKAEGRTDDNMLERDRLESKKISETNVVTSQLPYDLGGGERPRGPKRLRPLVDGPQVVPQSHGGRAFGNVPLQLELKLNVLDSPNSAGVIIDAVRCAKLALDHQIGGPLVAPSAYFMKTPPQQFTDDEARQLTETYLANPEMTALQW